jgi:hypothetical protein
MTNWCVSGALPPRAKPEYTVSKEKTTSSKTGTWRCSDSIIEDRAHLYACRRKFDVEEAGEGCRIGAVSVKADRVRRH